MHCVARMQIVALIRDNDGPGEELILFLPRFWLQETNFTHCPYDDLHPNQPRRRGNLLCRTDWLRLRGIAGTECAILPIREVAANPRCSACEHPRTGERPTARRRSQSPTCVGNWRIVSYTISQGQGATNSTPTLSHSSGTHFCSVSLPPSPSHSWEFPHQIRLAVSKGNWRH